MEDEKLHSGIPDFKTKEQFKIYIQRIDEQICHLKELKKEVKKELKNKLSLIIK